MSKNERIQESLVLYLRRSFLLHCREYDGCFCVPEDNLIKIYSLVVSDARTRRRFKKLSRVEFDFCVQTVYEIDVLPIL